MPGVWIWPEPTGSQGELLIRSISYGSTQWRNWRRALCLPTVELEYMCCFAHGKDIQYITQATNSTRDNFGCEIDLGKVFKLAIWCLSFNSRSRRDVIRLSNKRSPYLFGVATANRTKVTTPNKYGAEIIARMSDWENQNSEHWWVIKGNQVHVHSICVFKYWMQGISDSNW